MEVFYIWSVKISLTLAEEESYFTLVHIQGLKHTEMCVPV